MKQLIIFLIIYYTRTYSRHSVVGTLQRQGEEEERRRIETKGKPRTPTPAIDALIGDEQQTGKEEERRKKERYRKRVSNPATLDPSVAFYDPQGSYGEA